MQFLNQNQRSDKINEINNNKTILSNSRILSIEEEYKKSIEDKRNIMDNIYINHFFVIFDFCCIRKIKNINCYLLEEGLEIIKERLDVLNIFKKLYYDEKIQEMLKDKQEDIDMTEIDMTELCKQKLI